MILRLSIGSGICVLMGALIYLLGQLSPPAVRSAQHLLGERWYELELKDERVGYLHTRALRDRLGRWLFTSELRFAVNPGEPVTMIDQLIFDGTPPYDLRVAAHQNKRRDREDSVTIARTETGYRASMRSTDNGTPQHHKDLDWQYDLGDYVAFETWLRLSAPRVGAVKTVPTLDFSRLQIVSKKYRVVDRNQTGYQVENPAPFSYTSIQLDADYAPVALEMSGLFNLKRSSRAKALRPRSALQAASYFIPTDRPLTNHTRIERMVLGVHGTGDSDAVWSDAVRQDDGWTLTLHANPLSSDPYGNHLEETVGFPVSSHRIGALARDAVGDVTDNAGRVAALNSYVHSYLTYQSGAPPQTVLGLIDHPVGDCTEFADLFTTLARSLDIPARTVFGLAYDDSDSPAFAFHAWNEVSVDGIWQSVDPTWNQMRVDATHIPLPADHREALRLLTGTTKLSFSVREVDYFAEG